MKRAFTLAETMVSLAVSVMLFAMLMGVIVAQARLSTATGNYVDMNEQNRVALTVFDNDLRAARSVSVMESNRLVADVVTSVDAAGGMVVATVEYRYDLGAGKLTRTVGGKSRLLIDGAVSGGFVYLNKDDQVLTSVRILEVKKVMLNMKLKRGVSRLTTSDYVVSAIVAMRSCPVGV